MLGAAALVGLSRPMTPQPIGALEALWGLYAANSGTRQTFTLAFPPQLPPHGSVEQLDATVRVPRPYEPRAGWLVLGDVPEVSLLLGNNGSVAHWEPLAPSGEGDRKWRVSVTSIVVRTRWAGNARGGAVVDSIWNDAPPPLRYVVFFFFFFFFCFFFKKIA
jgi:hypothetical protein